MQVMSGSAAGRSGRAGERTGAESRLQLAAPSVKVVVFARRKPQSSKRHQTPAIFAHVHTLSYKWSRTVKQNASYL